MTHPLAKIVESLRKIILSTDPEVGEEIKWNAPTFLYSGEMKSWEDWLAENGIAVEEKRTWELGRQSVYFPDPDRHLIEIATPGSGRSIDVVASNFRVLSG